MSFNRVMFSSATDIWYTPKDVYEKLNKEFNFDFDPCPINPNFNGLEVNWGDCSFCNPPYSKIKFWVEKSYKEFKYGKTVVLLIPSRTDTKWWHEYVMKASEIRFIKGRLKFGGAKNSAPFPSCIVVFKKNKTYLTKHNR